MKGKLIAIYGINNIGKSTQAHMLVERIKELGHSVSYLKYPLYDLAPTGPAINAYLREGNPHRLTPKEFQILQTANRLHYDHVLRETLDSGTHVVTEDYKGTGIAWAVGAGVDKAFISGLNENLVSEDVVILLGGKRFSNAREKGHMHEENDGLMRTVQQVHRELATEHGWHVVDANQEAGAVAEDIWGLASPVLK